MPYIRIALDSVRLQTRLPDEVVVVENGSSDDTVEYLRSQRDIRLIEQLTLVAAPENWSRAVAETTGDYVKVLCADDQIDACSLQLQAEELERHQDAVMVISPRRIVSPSGRTVVPRLGLGGTFSSH